MIEVQTNLKQAKSNTEAVLEAVGQGVAASMVDYSKSKSAGETRLIAETLVGAIAYQYHQHKSESDPNFERAIRALDMLEQAARRTAQAEHAAKEPNPYKEKEAQERTDMYARKATKIIEDIERHRKAIESAAV